MKVELNKLAAQVIVDRGMVLTTASNLQSYLSTVRKYEREAAEVRLFERVPRRPEKEKLRAAIVDALVPGGLRPTVTVRERTAARRALPATLPEGPRFEPTLDDVRGVLDVSIELPGATSDSLKEILRRLGAMLRLTFTTAATPLPDGLRLRAEAYFFYTDNPFPKVAVRERVLEAALRAGGIDSGALAGDAQAQSTLDALATHYREMSEKLADYGRALDMQAELTRSDAQMRFARDRASEASERAPRDLLRAPNPASPGAPTQPTPR